MEVSERLQGVVDELREQLGARAFYVVDITEDKASEDEVGTLVFGIRDANVPALAARARTAQTLRQKVQQPVGVEVFSDAEEELEYLFDRYLRPYISSHDGIVTIDRIDEPAKQLWINMDGGCSGCPSSIATLKHGIERTLRRHLPWVERVESSTAAAEPDFNIALDFSNLGSEGSEAQR